jgi:limonene-1,2-epoxide hydrolase
MNRTPTIFLHANLRAGGKLHHDCPLYPLTHPLRKRTIILSDILSGGVAMANEKDLIRKFSEHYQKQEVEQLVNLFSEDATYHDTFYGAFTGHAKIKDMFQLFFRDGKNYVWDMRKVVAEPGTAMAEFFFSFLTTDQRNPERPVKMAGVGIFAFAGGRISRFHEYFDVGPVLLQMGLAPEAVVRHLQKRLEKGKSYTSPEVK